MSVPPWLLRVVMIINGVGLFVYVVGSLAWIIRQRLHNACTPEAQVAARQGLRRLLVGIVLAVGLLGAGIAMSIRAQELLYIWITAPIAVLLPPLLLAWWGHSSSKP